MRLRKLFHQYGLCLLAVVPFLIPIVRSFASDAETTTMGAYLAACFMGVLGGGVSPEMVLFLLFTQFAPCLILLYLFSGTFLADCETNFVYVVTRSRSIRRWFFGKTGTLFLQVFLSIFLTFLLAGILGLCRGLRFSAEELPIYGRLLFYETAPLFVLLFVQNAVSLWLGRSRSFLLLFLVYFLSILLGTVCYHTPGAEIWVPLLPTSSKMYFWHADSPDVPGLSGGPIPGFTAAFSVIWLLLLWAALCAVFLGICKRKDLITFGKGDSQ